MFCFSVSAVGRASAVTFLILVLLLNLLSIDGFDT